MGRRSAGFLHKSRKFLRKKPRERGMPPPSKFLMKYDVGQKVVIDIFPYFKEGGFPHRRYQGKVGVVAGKRGHCYLVDVKVGRKVKHLIVSPIHLKPHQEQR